MIMIRMRLSRRNVISLLLQTLFLQSSKLISSVHGLNVTPTRTSPTYKYFAFGSNMVPETMTALRQLNPISMQAAILPGYRLEFSLAGLPKVEPSAATLVPLHEDETEEESENGGAMPIVVHGVLYELTESDFATVGSTEGVPISYRWQSCQVYPYIGNDVDAGQCALLSSTITSSVQAYTLVSTSSNSSNRSRRRHRQSSSGSNNKNNSKYDYDIIPPSKSYRDLLIQGAKQFRMDAAYVKKLEMTPTATDLWIPNGISGKALDIAIWRQRLFFPN